MNTCQHFLIENGQVTQGFEMHNRNGAPFVFHKNVQKRLLRWKIYTGRPADRSGLARTPFLAEKRWKEKVEKQQIWAAANPSLRQSKESR